MQCRACGHDNREGARFCRGCGGPLAVACPACGTELPPDARFCDGCGERIAAAPPAPAPAPAAADPRAYTPPHLAEKILRDRTALEGERRTVTVLFADAVGSTPIGERLDAEALYTIMQRAAGLMIEAVHRYEGTVTQFRGDGVMALFGAPIAHEDAARRAVAAALAMQRALTDYAAEVRSRFGVELRFRVGLNTGPVVVGAISDALVMDYTAIGDTVNLAARMEEIAEPGAVFLTTATERAARDFIQCESLGALAVKGKAAPVIVFRALRERPDRTRLDAAAGRGLSPFVGREPELAVLRGYLDQARQGHGQVVFVTGDAGIGKSRLLLELRRSMDESLGWLEGHCSAIGRGSAYLPIIDIVKRSAGVEEGDDDARIIARVEAATAAWDEAARATVPYLKYLLSVDPGDARVAAMDPRERRAGIFDALRALLLQESRRRPLVIAIEDLHWVDELSEEALAALLDVIATAPVLLIVTSRPGHVHRLGERTYVSRLALGQLRPEDSRALTGHLLHSDALPDDLERPILEKAEGNPFFIEEVTRSLVEGEMVRRVNGGYALARPIEQIRVPDTIQEVILARIDRLAEEARRAMQLASVIGREFTVRLLDRIADTRARLDDLLSELKALELIYEKAYYPELAYMFKHALTHDVAYATLLLERRKALHRLVGAAIEELFADRLAEQYETLAHHYFEGEDWPKALDYLVKAGDKAAAAYANDAALEFYARALAVCDRLGPSTLPTATAVAHKRGFLVFNIGYPQRAIPEFDRMVSLARALGDRHDEGMALAFRGLSEVWAHEFETAEATLRAALARAGEEFDDVRLNASLFLSTCIFAVRPTSESEQLMRVAEELAVRLDDPLAKAEVAHGRGLLHNWDGRFDNALAVMDRGREPTRVINQPFWNAANAFVEALILGGKGEYDRSFALIHMTIANCDRVGEVLWRARGLNIIGWLYAELENHEQALEWNTRSLEAALGIDSLDPEIENNARINLGDNLIALGRADEAEAHFQRVERVVSNPRPQERWAIWIYPQHLFHSYGELWLARGDLDKALAYADECLDLATSTGRRKNIVKARRLRGRVFLARGELDAAEHELLTALDLAREVGNPPQLWKTYAAQGELRAAQGRAEDARAAYGEALAVIDGVAAGLTDTGLRQTFLGSAQVQGIRRAAQA
jgi:class 3 adenylate cyclase/tetratricopeptide (TPR) repeat protein